MPWHSTRGKHVVGQRNVALCATSSYGNKNVAETYGLLERHNHYHFPHLRSGLMLGKGKASMKGAFEISIVGFLKRQGLTSIV